MDEDMPIRLSYLGNTFINNSSYQGRLKESTQLGAELIGDGTVQADAEILAMVEKILAYFNSVVCLFRLDYFNWNNSQ